MQRALCWAVILVCSLHTVSSVNSEAQLLMLDILSQACSATTEDVIEFYSSVRSQLSPFQDIQYPIPAANSNATITGIAHNKIKPADGDLTVIPFFDGSFPLLYTRTRYSELERHYFKWCLYLYGGSEYGCRNGTETEATSGFQLLGLLDMFNYHSNPDDALSLVISAGTYQQVLEESLLVVTIKVPWSNETVGVYFTLSVSDAIFHDLIAYPHQRDLFLVAGQKKIFNVDILTINDLTFGQWYKGDKEVLQVVDVSDCNCTQPAGDHRGECIDPTPSAIYSYIAYSVIQFGGNCEFGDTFRTRRRRFYLSLTNPSVNDTGHYNFRLLSADYSMILLEHTTFISVVFVEFPFDQVLFTGAAVNLSCVVKAPANSSINWIHAGQMVDYDSQSCNRVTRHTQALDETFSLFYITLEICEVEQRDSGHYECQVISSEDQEPMQINTNILVNETKSTLPSDPALSQQFPIIIGTCVAGVILVLLAGLIIAIIVLVVVFTRRSARRKRLKMLKHRPSNHLLLKPQFVKGETYINLCSPDIVKKGELDFPRENLELEFEIGRGKFGRVFRAKAHGMVAGFPNVNSVAVKTTLNADSYNEWTRLVSELQVLKILHRQPHRNICNLLGYCFETKPPYMILEYACYGNLKNHLISCRDALLASGQEVAIDATPPTPGDDSGGANLGQLSIVGTSATNPLSMGLFAINPKQDSKSPTDPMTPGVIRESQLCDFALQIASGLKHLSELNIVHCDIAARNILIAEGELVKISDFGMAKETAVSDTAYQNLVIHNDESIVPARWAAPELLDGEPHSQATDMWSYAVTVWEIASYASEPFSEIKLGVSLSPLSDHIRRGNKLPIPAGLSNYLYRQLCECWSIDSSLRPNAEEMVDFFSNLNPRTQALEDMLEEVVL